MSTPPNSDEVRQVVLEAIASIRTSRPDDPSLQLNTVHTYVTNKLGERLTVEAQQEVLTQFQRLLHTGQIAWGLNLDNPNSPFFHLTSIGRRTLATLSRDPANPAGYLAYLASAAPLNPIAESYLKEGLSSFVAGFFKAAAVMVGAASESLILELRDTVTSRLTSLGVAPMKTLMDWRVKTVLDGLHALFNSKKSDFPREMREEYEAYFLAFAQQIRAGRNDAGHPSSIDPVTEEGVHASFLIFPELARLTVALRTWTASTMT